MTATQTAPYYFLRSTVRGEYRVMVKDDEGNARTVGYVNQDGSYGWQGLPNRRDAVWISGYPSRATAAQVLWQDWLADNIKSQ